jgi:quinol monooxygenase YgiN
MRKTGYWILFLSLACSSAGALDQESATQMCCPILEFRQYTLHPGKRDVLIDLFDREFVESQEALGMRILGQFRDLDDPNRFVWLRGFRDMTTRAEALRAFYSGPVWKANRVAANDTMVNTDNVLLLHPAISSSVFNLKKAARPAVGTNQPAKLIVATIYYLEESAVADFVDFFKRNAAPALAEAGASILAFFVTENSPNNFPALPVRENEHVLVSFSAFPDEATYSRYDTALSHNKIAEAMKQRLQKSPEVHRLMPTSRSLLR